MEDRPLDHALATLRLAARLGIRGPSFAPEPLPYTEGADDLVFAAPLTSLLCGRRMFFWRGWKAFDGCVKGFHALGILAEHAEVEQRALAKLTARELRVARRAFVFARGLGGLPEREVEKVDLLALALWRAYARRTIVCATSANMGMCLHQALRLMQRATVAVGGRRVPILGSREGSLIIWCPDVRADFMSGEKWGALEALAAERPRLTTLKTYINRRERDPAALRDALTLGGYFFPTNPQSPDELERLLAEALAGIDPRGRLPARALASLGARARGRAVRAGAAVDGGLYGMAAAYLRLLEETLARGRERALCVWNPASIGAALAGLSICDESLRNGRAPAGLAEFAPRLAAFLRAGRLGRDVRTRIHGVFDIANLQSLAQLFGATVTRHYSGRQTAYVGLGSSSYANGNLCFEALRASADADGAFRGRASLHPATHALNPVAQALVFGEDLLRVARGGGPSLAGRGREALAHCRKPEPAGAAALAGYLLARLDAGSLSAVEIAYALRAAGFTPETFLEFAGQGASRAQGACRAAAERWLRGCADEGPEMGAFAGRLLAALGKGLGRLRREAAAARRAGRAAYRFRPLDDAAFEALDPAVYVNLTGDNTAQPTARLVARLVEAADRRALP